MLGDFITDLFIGSKSMKGPHWRHWDNEEEEDGEMIAIINIQALMKAHDFNGKHWTCWGPRFDINRARKLKVKEDSREAYESCAYEWSSAEHLQRIRNLMEAHDVPPIDIEFMRDGIFKIQDGNHRLLAAYLRGDTAIKSSTIGFCDSMYEYCAWNQEVNAP